MKFFNNYVESWQYNLKLLTINDSPLFPLFKIFYILFPNTIILLCYYIFLFTNPLALILIFKSINAIGNSFLLSKIQSLLYFCMM